MKRTMPMIAAAALLVVGCSMTALAADSTPGPREKPAQAQEEKKVSLSKPYPASYPGAPTDRISLQYAVIELGRQAGLHYDWNTSAKNAEELCRRWIYPDIKNQPFGSAMKEILSPLGLKYEIRGGNTIVLTKPAVR